MSDKKLQWIEESYLLATQHGLESLSVNTIARRVGTSKSSFYHYFGDLEMLKLALLKHHVGESRKFFVEICACENVSPDIINAFVKRKVDLLFHKQLRIHREDPVYGQGIEEAYLNVENAAMDLWSEHFGLERQKLFSRKLFRFVSEHFLLSITAEGFDAQWLRDYLEGIADLLQDMKMI
ncbi:MAG: TetR/AcrR family transcriptional regulator [Bacteroidota bacterium]